MIIIKVTMKRGLILLSLISFALSLKIFGFKFFIDEKEQDQKEIHSSDQIQKGNLITYDIQNKIRTIVEQAYVFNGNNTVKNVLFIQQQLKNTYEGNWVIGIYGSYGSGETPTLAYNFGVSSYSTGGQWWIYWKGANHYQPNQGYYIARQQGSSPTYVCLSNQNTTHTTDTFRNIVNACQMDFHDIQNYTAQVQSFLHIHNQNIYPTVTAVKDSLSFFLCSWGSSTSNTILKTEKLGFNIVSTPKVQ